LLGARASVFVPTTCPPVNLRRLPGYCAVITVTGDIYEESRASAEHFAAETGALLLHPFDQPTTVAGAGTVAAAQEAGELVDVPVSGTAVDVLAAAA
jgi:threonine dehydratase